MDRNGIDQWISCFHNFEEKRTNTNAHRHEHALHKQPVSHNWCNSPDSSENSNPARKEPAISHFLAKPPSEHEATFEHLVSTKHRESGICLRGHSGAQPNTST